MRILFYFGHPAQYLFFRDTIKQLIASDKNKITILIKTKDVLEELIKSDKLDYINILPKERKKSKLSILLSLLKRNFKLLTIVRKTGSKLLIGTDASIAHVGMLLRVKRISITEDDYEVVKQLGNLTYPFTNTILCPEVCDVGKWKEKKVGYPGYMKLGYLHPSVFTLDVTVLDNYGIKGISHNILNKIIEIFQDKKLTVFISSEGNLDEKYHSFLLKIKPCDMHHILASANMLVSDSQSMSVEAAILGVPSIRLSDFSGRISVLEELEHVYGLTFGIKPKNDRQLFEKLNELLQMQNLKEVFKIRQKKMLINKINVSPFLKWFVENYPQSVKTVKEEPDFFERFKSKSC